ncbi:hypothetical protein FBZ91_10712 [Nitrospirillum viridazoti]|uniref:hypothetical protein n=1 Tax=Nitrospirillum viridazoti TaxID=3144925 RepID=UPI0011ACEFCB|nr:hypothetical protein [Nitrospirillum amazonense]TWB37699.1 hypothetical protein FBZ91_10712 [Nitrospirillum amazonense]
MAKNTPDVLAHIASIIQNKQECRAALLDLSGVVDAYEPVIHRIVDAELKAAAASTDHTVGINTYGIGSYGWLLIGDADSGETLLAATDRVCTVFADAHQGKVDVHWFDLPGEAKPLVACLRILMGDKSLATPSPATDEVVALLRIERGLHGADLSSLIRRQPVYRVGDDGISLEPIMLEQTVDLTALERLFDVTIIGAPWMHARVTEILDRRMLHHLLHDEMSPRLPIAIKLHAGSVRQGAFAALLDELPAHWHARLAIELPYAEWLVAPDAVEEALAVGRRRQCLMVLDHVPVDRAAEATVPKDVLLRLMPGVPAADGETAAALRPHTVPSGATLRQLVRTLGADRCILTHCDSLALVHHALDAGFRMLQGQAVADFAEMRQQMVPSAETTVGQAAVEDGPEADAPQEEIGPPVGLWPRLLRWFRPRHRATTEDTPTEPQTGPNVTKGM